MTVSARISMARQTGIFLALLLIAVIFRLPWFFQDVVNWDEGVFILAGQAIAQDHLPYTVVWDNKPPLGSAFHALVILLLPGSLAAIRLGGAVLVAISAYLLFRSLSRALPPQYAFLGAALLVVAVSVLITDGMAVMTEHVALVPLLGAMLLAGGATQPRTQNLAIGALLAVAALVRANLAFVLVAAVLLLPLIRPATDLRGRVTRGVQVAAGALVVFGAVLLLYAAQGHAQLLYDSAIRVPLSHSGSGMGPSAAAAELFAQALRIEDEAALFEPRRVLSVGFWAIGLIGLVMIAMSRRHWGDALAFAAICLCATLLSMIFSGYIWSHHLIQLAPFFGAGAAYCLATLLPAGKAWLPVAFVATLVIGFSLLRADAYRSIHSAYAAHGSAYSGPVFEVADHLRARMGPNDSVFVTNDILLYWLLDRYPVIPVAAFPAHLWEEQSILRPLFGPAMTTDAILRQIITLEPTWLVLPADDGRSQFFAQPGRAFPAKLLEGYDLEGTVAGRHLYRRSP